MQGKEKNVDEERTILISGSKRGGKSSVVLRFLDRLQDVPKATMALEYTFGRRPHSNNLGKDIAHLWELGGGASQLVPPGFVERCRDMIPQ